MRLQVGSKQGLNPLQLQPSSPTKNLWLDF